MVEYPRSVDAALGRPIRFRRKTILAVRAFARTKPWQGAFDDRKVKFRQLHADLCRVYGVCPELVILGEGTGDSGGSHYQPEANVITLSGRLSVITFLHEWGHVVRGRSESEACRWSLRLFRRCFPRSWSRLRFEGHVARAAEIRFRSG